jgi:hypothetical protein
MEKLNRIGISADEDDATLFCQSVREDFSLECPAFEA